MCPGKERAMAGWTCPQCGLDYDTVTPAGMPAAIRAFPAQFARYLAVEGDRTEATLRQRPDEKTWSVVEYTMHVAELFDLFADVLQRIAAEDNPVFDFPDPDERAGEAGYNERAIAAVVAEMESGGARLADVMEATPADAWSRPGTFPWGERSMLTMGQNAVHEGRHHLLDVTNVLTHVT
jgi:hypothetical protein